MKGIIIGSLFLVACVILQFYILPKLGINTCYPGWQ